MRVGAGALLADVVSRVVDVEASVALLAAQIVSAPTRFTAVLPEFFSGVRSIAQDGRTAWADVAALPDDPALERIDAPDAARWLSGQLTPILAPISIIMVLVTALLLVSAACRTLRTEHRHASSIDGEPIAARQTDTFAEPPARRSHPSRLPMRAPHTAPR